MANMQPAQPMEIHLKVDNNTIPAVQLLAESSQLSASLIKQAMQKGCVWHTRHNRTQRLRRSKKTLVIGDELHMYYNEAVLQSVVNNAKLLADEHAFSIWFKPYGMLCQGSKWSDHTTINRFVETHLTPQRPAFIVHRLDRATTGVMVIAHSKTAAQILSNAFEKRQTKKTYQAIVHGDFSNQPTPLTINETVNGKTAISHVHCVQYCSNSRCSLVQIDIDTGRKHQIRVHLSSLGFPIVGDRLYGVEGDSQDLQLQAIELAIPHVKTGDVSHYRVPLDLRLSLSV